MTNNHAPATSLLGRSPGRSIGLFGGSFNPIHNGHIALARQLKALAGLDEVWLMVSPQNPLKKSQDLLDDRLRFEMVEKALNDKGEDAAEGLTDGLVASDYELRLPKPSYTWNTLQHLKEDYPQHTFTLLIGADNWQLFPKWYHADDIIRNYRIVIYPRRGYTIDRTALPDNVVMADCELLDVSSTEIREKQARGESISRLVPLAIEGDIKKVYE